MKSFFRTNILPICAGFLIAWLMHFGLEHALEHISHTTKGKPPSSELARYGSKVMIGLLALAVLYIPGGILEIISTGANQSRGYRVERSESTSNTYLMPVVWFSDEDAWWKPFSGWFFLVLTLSVLLLVTAGKLYSIKFTKYGNLNLVLKILITIAPFIVGIVIANLAEKNRLLALALTALYRGPLYGFVFYTIPFLALWLFAK